MAALIYLLNASRGSRGLSKAVLKIPACNEVIGRSIVSLAHCQNRRATPLLLSNSKTHVDHQGVLSCSVSLPQLQFTRSTNFFNKLPAEKLWKGVTSVSNAGKRRGRGKGVGKKIAKNLNRGQVIGIGVKNMQWPGLNAPILRGKELVQQQKLPKDEAREEKLLQIRNSMGQFRPFRIDPLERGWTGSRMPGRSLGPPDPVGEETFEGFECRVLEFKTVSHMTAVFGRKRQFSVFVVTGNGNGLGGFSLGKSSTSQSCLKKGKNGGVRKLIHFQRYNDHTVMHDFFTQYGCTKIFVKKKPEGYGLVCHRVLKTICEVIGIKDMYAKVEGSTKNVQNLTKAFFLGLMNQKSHQELANEKGLHLVEFREEKLNFPKVIASPESGEVRTLSQIPKDEELNFDLHIMGGKMELQKKKYPPGYTSLYGWEIYRKKYAKTRNREKIRQQLLFEHGEVRSFLADKYPECSQKYVKRDAEAES